MIKEKLKNRNLYTVLAFCLFLNASNAKNLWIILGDMTSESYALISDEKEHKDTKTKKSDGKTASLSSLISAPKEIPAGGHGNVILTITNPLSDTLNLSVLYDVPEGWEILNELDTVQLLPDEKRSFVIILQPSQSAELGVQKLLFNFWDQQKEINIQQKVDIQIKENHALTIREITGIRFIHGGSESVDIIYEISNLGNVPEKFVLLSKIKNITLLPSQIYHDTISTSISRNSRLRNLFVSCQIQPEYQDDKIICSISLTALTNGLDKPLSSSTYPFNYSIRSNVTAARLNINQGLTGTVFNSSQRSKIAFNASHLLIMSQTSSDILSRLIGDASYTRQHSHSIAKLSIGKSIARGSPYFRIPITFTSLRYHRLFTKNRSLSATYSANDRNNVSDTVNSIHQFHASFGLKSRFNTHQLLSVNDNSQSLLSENSIVFRLGSLGFRTDIASFSKDLSQRFTAESLALKNVISYNKRATSFSLNTFVSGKEFSSLSSDLLLLRGNASYTKLGYGLSLSHDLMSKEFRLNGLNDGLRSNSVITANKELWSSFNTSFRLNRVIYKFKNGSKNYLSRTHGANVGIDWKHSLGILNTSLSIQEQRAYIDSDVNSNMMMNSLLVSHNSSDSRKTKFNTSYRRNSNGQFSSQSLRSGVTRKINTYLSGRVTSGFMLTGNSASYYNANTNIGISYSKLNYQFDVGGSINVSPTRTNYVTNLSLNVSLNVRTRDSINYKKLDGIVLDENKKPVKGVLLQIGRNLLISDDHGLFYLHNIRENKTIINIDKTSLPFGMTSNEGFQIEISTFKEDNNIIINLHNSARIEASSEIIRTGLLKSKKPDYNSISVRLTALGSGKELNTRFDSRGLFSFGLLDADKYRLTLTQTAKSEKQWQIDSTDYEFELTHSQVKSLHVKFIEKSKGIKMQKVLN